MGGFPRPKGCANESSGLWVYPQYNAAIFAPGRLGADTKLLMVPPTYGSHNNCAPPSVWCTNQTYAQWLELNKNNFVSSLSRRALAPVLTPCRAQTFYRDWAFSDDRIVGFDPFPLYGCVTDTCRATTSMAVGLMQMPEILREYVALGRQIVNRDRVKTDDVVRRTPIFTAGERNSHGQRVLGYRIPGFVAMPSSRGTTLLVVAEARKYTCSDIGAHDIVAKTSTDFGQSWSVNQIVVEPGTVWGPAEANASLFNPTPVYDADTGAVHVLFTYFRAKYMSHPPEYYQFPAALELWQITSTTNGRTWQAPVNISSVPTPNDEMAWCHRTTGGGGNGIQLRYGPQKGRLIVPGYHHMCGDTELAHRYSHILISDDHGHSWRLGSSFMPGSAEGSVAEVGAGAPGELLYAARRCVDLLSAQASYSSS